ncbi:hypothetical protein BJ138DRAFT_1182988 [Hygrophoropsis aurantiaca]|uniref:Uncharacterized protein n=1 Tax=Hygrophoropsis aurantiaca TaxID=72124 RepID=A0ACB7ZZX0_9AGAM|nr:hypothetical protein BJ138DRAFT_1182988 [Hygrophoropsis aurantiaca]
MDETLPRLDKMDTHSSSITATTPIPKHFFTRNFLRRLCHILHCLLIVLHFFLVGLASLRIDHLIIMSIGSHADMMATLLSVLLQAFYTLYTALLVYLTQRISVWHNLSQYQRVTTLHDISGAWAGLGSALNGLWNQFRLPSSPLSILSVAAYLICITTLHITSSSIMQFQNFENMVRAPVETTLGWPHAASVDVDDMDWTTITSVGPFVGHLSGIASAGAANGTVYDILSANTGTGNATVNATSVMARCALLTGVIYGDDLLFNVSSGGEMGSVNIGIILWKDQIIWIPSYKENSLVFLVTTAIDASPTIFKDALLPLAWPYNNPNATAPSNSSVLLASLAAYAVGCNVSTESQTSVVVDVQTNAILAFEPPFESQLQPEARVWDIVPASSATNLSGSELENYGWVDNVFQASALLGSNYKVCTANQTLECYELNTSEDTLLQLIGANSTQIYPDYKPMNSSDTTPTFTLSLHAMETALSFLLAKSMWTAGMLGKEGGGFDRGNGSVLVTEYDLQMRLNINWVPLLFALGASIVLFILELRMTAAGPVNTEGDSAVDSTGLLQIIWLTSHSYDLRRTIGDVKLPTIDNLRAAGMLRVCFADLGRLGQDVEYGHDSPRKSEDLVLDNGTKSEQAIVETLTVEN